MRLSIYGLLLTTLYGIALAIKDYGIIKELQIGNEVSDSVLYWNDILPLTMILLQALFFSLLVGYLSVRGIEIYRNINTESCKEKSSFHAMVCKIDLLLKKVIERFIATSTSKFETKYGKLVMIFLLLLAILFNPFMRFFASLVFPAENLFHFIQQVRISLIFQISQLFWVVFLWAIIYVLTLRRKRTTKIESV